MDVFYDSMDEENEMIDGRRSSEQSFYEDTDKCDVIPFYNGNICKKHVNISHQSSVRKKTLMKRANYLKNNKKKSYVDLMMIKVKKEEESLLDSPKDSTKSNCDESDEFLSTSFASCVSTCDCSISNVSLNSKFLSISQRSLQNTPKKRSNLTNIPKLGGLGAHIQQEKLESLRKRQSYGQMVSEKNKIKIAENRILRNLESAIKDKN